MALDTDETTMSADEAWKRLKGDARQVKTNARNVRDASASGDIQALRLVNLAATLAGALSSMAVAVAVPGLTEAARAAKPGFPTYDPVAEYNAVVPRMEAVRDWIVTNCPKEAGTGYLLIATFAGDGTLQHRTIPSAALTALRTELDLLLATLG